MKAETSLLRKFWRCGVLSDLELDALREIERRLRWESPELIRLFNSVAPQPPKPHRKRARTRVLVAASAFAALTLLGPRMLNDAEVSAQQRRPLPQTAPPDTTITGRTGPASAVTAPVAVIDVVIGDSSTVATTAWRSPRAEHEDSRSLDRGPEHHQSLSRKA
jgi:Protein of unknown function (DUF3040)